MLLIINQRNSIRKDKATITKNSPPKTVKKDYFKKFNAKIYTNDGQNQYVLF